MYNKVLASGEYLMYTYSMNKTSTHKERELTMSKIKLVAKRLCNHCNKVLQYPCDSNFCSTECETAFEYHSTIAEHTFTVTLKVLRSSHIDDDEVKRYLEKLLEVDFDNSVVTRSQA